ncbi:agamous-like MADS-box protein AGL15 isoform X1 [Primulina huaijiensis]|uniref:agamous-like MADS-box protein AGL15 isoform X1 n=1 Tax=Primulina huaijiensis TaxID=1492673 RepID=UPI003CC753D6
MGRGKIEIKKIENANSRQVTFSKRRAGLLKKAHELAVLCDADVAVIVFSSTGRLFEFSSSEMKSILSRYNKCLDSTQVAALEYNLEKQEQKEVDVLKEEILKLKSKQLQLLGKDLTGASLQELRELEEQLNEGLLCVKERKEQILMQQLAQSKIQERNAVLENETLRRQVQEFQGFLSTTNLPSPHFVQYELMEKSNSTIKDGSRSPETTCDNGLADEDSDTTLQLGPPVGVIRKKRVVEGETHSSSS